MEETDDEPGQLTGLDREINQLLGLFDVPAFVRRGQDLEYAIGRLHLRCGREREQQLEMVRLRLRQMAAVVGGPAQAARIVAGPFEVLWHLSGSQPPEWTARPSSTRRQRAAARDLIAALTRFNQRWQLFVDGLNLDAINRMIDQYNRYYVLEKECSLGSAKLAARHFVPKGNFTREGLFEQYPLLPVPALLTAKDRNAR